MLNKDFLSRLNTRLPMQTSHEMSPDFLRNVTKLQHRNEPRLFHQLFSLFVHTALLNVRLLYMIPEQTGSQPRIYRKKTCISVMEAVTRTRTITHLHTSFSFRIKISVLDEPGDISRQLLCTLHLTLAVALYCWFDFYLLLHNPPLREKKTFLED